MWAHAHGVPEQRAILRSVPEDFRVEEVLEVAFSGSGEFDWVQVEKTGLTTETVAKLLARHAGVRDVSYSGLKDKNAVTTQWFSLHMLGAPSADWSAFVHEGCRVLRSERHHRKLRRGTHRVNRFELVLRDIDDVEAVSQRLLTVREQGVPNYFGEQRFGREGGNVEAARRLFAGQLPAGAGKRRVKRFQRGLYLSAARSYLFNRVLAQRVDDGSWQRALDGEVLILGDSNSVFYRAPEEDLTERLARAEVHPTGPLPGRSAGLLPEGAAAQAEQAVLAQEPALCEGLAGAGVDAARRSLRLFAGGLAWQGAWQGGHGALTLRFTLPRGCFATALVRELVDYRENVSK